MERQSLLSGRLSLSTSNLASPIAESTNIKNSRNETKFPWGGRQNTIERTLSTESLAHHRPSSKVKMAPISKIDARMFLDIHSKGLSSRIVKYHENSKKLNRSLSANILYNKPGQFPVVHLKKNDIKYIPKRNQSPSIVKIAPPDRSVFQAHTRSSIMRNSSIVPTVSLINSSKKFAENSPIIHPIQNDLRPTKSVLDALKEISRKRINSEELDGGANTKKYCKETCDSSLQSPYCSVITKRPREPPSSPNSKYSSNEQVIKKRMFSKNNEITSSLTSSLNINTPKRKLNDLRSHTLSPEKLSPDSSISRQAKQQCYDENLAPSNENQDQQSIASSISNNQEEVQQIDEKSKNSICIQYQKPKLTLFNKNYNNMPLNEDLLDEKNLENGFDVVSFVKPTNKKPMLTGKNAILERTQKSKLSLMLSCLSGELNSNEDVIDGGKLNEIAKTNQNDVISIKNLDESNKKITDNRNDNIHMNIQPLTTVQDIVNKVAATTTTPSIRSFGLPGKTAQAITDNISNGKLVTSTNTIVTPLNVASNSFNIGIVTKSEASQNNITPSFNTSTTAANVNILKINTSISTTPVHLNFTTNTSPSSIPSTSYNSGFNFSTGNLVSSGVISNIAQQVVGSNKPEGTYKLGINSFEINPTSKIQISQVETSTGNSFFSKPNQNLNFSIASTTINSVSFASTTTISTASSAPTTFSISQGGPFSFAQKGNFTFPTNTANKVVPSNPLQQFQFNANLSKTSESNSSNGTKLNQLNNSFAFTTEKLSDNSKNLSQNTFKVTNNSNNNSVNLFQTKSDSQPIKPTEENKFSPNLVSKTNYDTTKSQFKFSIPTQNTSNSIDSKFSFNTSSSENLSFPQTEQKSAPLFSFKNNTSENKIPSNVFATTTNSNINNSFKNDNLFIPKTTNNVNLFNNETGNKTSSEKGGFFFNPNEQISTPNPKSIFSLPSNINPPNLNVSSSSPSDGFKFTNTKLSGFSTTNSNTFDNVQNNTIKSFAFNTTSSNSNSISKPISTNITSSPSFSNNTIKSQNIFNSQTNNDKLNIFNFSSTNTSDKNLNNNIFDFGKNEVKPQLNNTNNSSFKTPQAFNFSAPTIGSQSNNMNQPFQFEPPSNSTRNFSLRGVNTEAQRVPEMIFSGNSNRVICKAVRRTKK